MKNEKRREIEYVALFSFFYFVLSRNLFNNKRIKSIFSSLNFLKKKKKIYATEATVCGLQCSIIS